jgi:ABC-type antimicrobial peptide transport system permease subunit
MEWDVLAWLLTVFSIVACGLATLGVYGILAFAVASRQRELGIRMALGASTARIGSLIAGGVVPMLIGGLLLGSAGGAGLAQVLRSRLVGVEPFDPMLWALAAAGLILVTAAATFLPARMAIQVNVADTLRTM